ncbi:hypothetical protein E0W68_05015 [Flavobacterium salilacus subsp. salilacus]|uniref:hypothetical protein n=1 Tax=Flavobacterium TaxID=237 RepID=UPI001074C3BE|nr:MULTISPECIES: hypothetical protein [Flavobacterium]KAF2519134.1 hypothetical protein E0W68_05015 [Flavobacterium salilacus subsp. salilacus]MBE1613313.1 hypothetical protein [Flavobacterium sp. SaA2.13]
MRILAIVLLSVITAQAQEKSLLHYFEGGKTEGHIRNYFMATNNHNLKNYHANATGGLIGYTTKEFNGFQVGISGVFTFKTFGANLNATDSVTDKSSKWEQELFDLNNPDNYYDLDRMEELFLKYRYKNSYIAVGKIPLEYHPLINKSDGRMKGFAFKGINCHIVVDSTLSVDVSGLNGVSPRSMTEWFKMHKAIGLVNNGYQPDGKYAAYEGYTATDMLAFIGVNKTLGRFNLNFWDTHIDDLLNTAWAEAFYHSKFFSAGIQYSYQIPYNTQKKLPYTNRYIQPGENGQVASIMLDYKYSGFETSVAYTKAFDSGRYLFPKEFGRDQFYTSMPRSRIEGFGNADVVKISLQYSLKEKGLTVGMDATGIDGPGAENYQFNKYGLDDYYQINSRLQYSFKDFLQGLDIAIMYVWRENKNVHTPADVFNVSDYSQLNVISNFNF